ncbi:MAG: hypothetical protein RLZZ231_1447 [Bacteroidota bacterium]|jgi:hypothetical protein
MNMKKNLTLFLLFYSLFFYSQSIVTTRVNDTVTHWKSKNSIGIDLNEMAFMNWSAGGNSSVSGLLKGNFVRRYSDEKIKWNNELIIRYGVNMQDGLGLRKTDDALQFNSTFGHRKDSLSNWYTSAKLNFNTQFTDGYAYPNTEIAISKPFAPAYFFLGIGTEYVNKDKKIVLYLSPLTSKSTLVLDQRLADQGAFGVVKAVYDSNGNLLLHGRKSKNELGVLVTAMHKKEVMKNVMLENRLSLYSDYINNFGNIDVDWQLQMDLLVNKYVKANIGLHLLYDDDIKAKEQINGEQVIVGPKLQLKQALGVGFVYNFKV